MARCCDGRTGERLSRPRYIVPVIIVIILVHLTLWKFVVRPKFFDQSEETGADKTEYGPGFSDRRFMEQSMSETDDAADEADAAFMEASGRSFEEVGQLKDQVMTKVRELPHSRRHQHRHRLRGRKNRYKVRRLKPVQRPLSLSTVAPSTSTGTTASSASTAKSAVQAEHRHDHNHHHHGARHQPSASTSTQPPTHQQQHHQQREWAEQQREREREREQEREKEREQERERERTRHISSERREGLQLTEEQSRKAQQIYEAQQHALKQRRLQQAAWHRNAEESHRRRQEQEQEQRQRWRESTPVPTTTTTHAPQLHSRANDNNGLRGADTWTHHRRTDEQQRQSAATPRDNDATDLGPFSIIKHEVSEADRVWRGHVDHSRVHASQSEHNRHHQQQMQPDYHSQVREQQEEAVRRQHAEREEARRREQYRQAVELRRQEELRRRQQAEQETHRQQHHHQRHHHHSHHRPQEENRVPPIELSNEIVPNGAGVRSKRDQAPIIVTALLDIGRGDWVRFTRPFDLYLEYLMDLLQLQNRIIVYGDRSVLAFLQSQGDLIDPSRLQLVEISLTDLPYYRFRGEIKEIMDEEQSNWREEWERSVQHHPEAMNPDYNILVNSKPYLLYNATQISRFDNSENFIWLDAGYSHGQKSMIPNKLWNPALPVGKLTVIKIKHDKIQNYAIKDVYRKQWTVMSGGLLAGDSATIDRFRRFYHKTFMDLLDDRKTDDDQTTLLLTVAHYHNMFNVLTGGWFDAFKLLPSR